MPNDPRWAPEPPVELPPGYVVHVHRRGELFVRDTGGDGQPVLLLHGWMFSADLNFWRNYRALEQAGYRVLAIDHRGHGRGIRSHARFRLTDCAADAAALLRQLDLPPALVVGYSMGGPIAQLMARDHADTVAGMVLCATSSHWTDLRQQVLWRSLALVRLTLGLAPDFAWRNGLRLAGFPDHPITVWTTSELTRGASIDLAEAGRELANWDSRSWLGDLEVPAAVVLTARDAGVPPAHQRELAELLGAPIFNVDADHGAAISAHRKFNRSLLAALKAVATAPARAVAA
jgi:pimeloyl-ACP methyl ester carboxylesterase